MRKCYRGTLALFEIMVNNYNVLPSKS